MEKRRIGDGDEQTSAKKPKRNEPLQEEAQRVLQSMKASGIETAHLDGLFNRIFEEMATLKKSVYQQSKQIKQYKQDLDFTPIDYDDILDAIKEKDYKAVRAMIHAGIERFGSSNFTFPLYYACEHGDKKMVEILLTHCDIPDIEQDCDALHLVCQKYQEPQASTLVKLLLDYGFEPRVKFYNYTLQVLCASLWSETKGLDSLQVAVVRKLEEVVWMLVNVADWIHETCLYAGQLKTIWDLCGSDISVRNSLLQFWSPHNHHLHPQRVKDTLMLVLLIAKRNEWKFDNNIVHLILSYVAFEAKWITESEAIDDTEYVKFHSVGEGEEICRYSSDEGEDEDEDEDEDDDGDEDGDKDKRFDPEKYGTAGYCSWMRSKQSQQFVRWKLEVNKQSS